MTTDTEWHEWRSKGLGGSDVAAVLGLSPWTSPYSLWAEKVGLIPRDPSTSEAQEAGKMLEVALTPWFIAKTGLQVHGEQQWRVNNAKQWMRCTVDGMVSSPADPMKLLGVAEWKVTQDSAESWAEQVPDYYACQATWNMLVTGTDRCWFGVLHTAFGRLKFRTYEFLLHEGDARFVMERCERFWMEHVVTGEPPPVDAHDATRDALAAMWPQGVPTGGTVAEDTLVAALEQRRQWQQTADMAQEQIDRISNEVRLVLGDTEVLTDGTGRKLASWRWQDNKRVDLNGLREVQPELVDAYTDNKPTRVLRFAKHKENSK